MADLVQLVFVVKRGEKASKGNVDQKASRVSSVYQE